MKCTCFKLVKDNQTTPIINKYINNTLYFYIVLPHKCYKAHIYFTVQVGKSNQFFPVFYLVLLYSMYNTGIK